MVAFIYVLNKGLAGLWWGLTTGESLCVVATTVVVLASNWPQLALAAVERSEAKSLSAEPTVQGGV